MVAGGEKHKGCVGWEGGSTPIIVQVPIHTPTYASAFLPSSHTRTHDTWSFCKYCRQHLLEEAANLSRFARVHAGPARSSPMTAKTVKKQMNLTILRSLDTYCMHVRSAVTMMVMPHSPTNIYHYIKQNTGIILYWYYSTSTPPEYLHRVQ